MKTVSLSGSPRENVGKKGAANLRREGSIPSVLYGGKEQIINLFFTDECSLKEAITSINNKRKPEQKKRKKPLRFL